MTHSDTPKTPIEALTLYRGKAQNLPDTPAKKKLLEDLAATEQVYLDLAKIVAAYPAKYDTFVDEKLKIARSQHDDAIGAVDDSDEVDPNLKTAINALRKEYDAQEKETAAAAKLAMNALYQTRSPLGKAESASAEALAELDTAISFPERATAWFEDVAMLARSVKDSAKQGNMRLAYAQYLELDDVYQTLILEHFVADTAALPAKGSPDWLREKLTALVLTRINAQYARFKAALSAEDAERAATISAEAEDAFVHNNGRRLAFFRQAQDIVVAPAAQSATAIRTVPDALAE